MLDRIRVWTRENHSSVSSMSLMIHSSALRAIMVLLLILGPVMLAVHSACLMIG